MSQHKDEADPTVSCTRLPWEKPCFIFFIFIRSKRAIQTSFRMLLKINMATKKKPPRPCCTFPPMKARH